ncbi:hypothetical protein Tco_0255713 [Tanacetum coccineum]
MVGINIDDLTIEQYLRLTSEKQTPSIVKKVDDVTINEYIEYEERMKRQYSMSSGSYFPTYSSRNTTIECPSTANFNAIQSNIKFNYDSEDIELDEEAGYITDEELVTSEHEELDPAHVNGARSLNEELSSEEDLDEWLKGELEKHMNVFQEEISLGIGKDRIKFDINGNLRSSNSPIEKVYMANTSQKEESFNPLEIGHDLFLYEAPACLQFEQNNRNYDAIDPQNETIRQTSPLLEKGG